ncbi:MAG: PEP-CTERM sorting domain-containing protein [Thermodesulfobacteriota bacterium]|nr:PEP-CTERM sorting domain-containing protein [Thermodesulfobacteriota bacterium]
MKMVLVFLFAVTLVLGGVGIARAVPMTLTDTTVVTPTATILLVDYVDRGRGYVNFLDSFGDDAKWTHHLYLDPATAEILAGTSAVPPRNEEGHVWRKLLTWEIAIGYPEDGSWDFGAVDTGNDRYDVRVSYLEDGELTIALGSLMGEFYIDQSDLEITYNLVPEPATTMLLMGTGLLVLAGLGKKRLPRKA